MLNLFLRKESIFKTGLVCCAVVLVFVSCYSERSNVIVNEEMIRKYFIDSIPLSPTAVSDVRVEKCKATIKVTMRPQCRSWDETRATKAVIDFSEVNRVKYIFSENTTTINFLFHDEITKIRTKIPDFYSRYPSELKSVSPNTAVTTPENFIFDTPTQKVETYLSDNNIFSNEYILSCRGYIVGDGIINPLTLIVSGKQDEEEIEKIRIYVRQCNS